MTVVLQKPFGITPVYDILLRGSREMPVGLYQLHMATAAQLCRLHYANGSLTTIKARLKTLVEQEYIQQDERPTKRLRTQYHYVMGAKGMHYLESLGYDTNESFRGAKEIHTDSVFVRHTLEINDVLISTSLLGQVSSHYYLSRFVHERTLQRKPCLLSWQGKQRRLIPDGLLDFRRRMEDGSERRRTVLLEHDCGTEYQSAFRKRIRSYIVMLRTNAYQEHFGVKTVGIVFTTFEGEKRLGDMRRWTFAELKATNEPSSIGLNLFFTNQPRPPDPRLWLEPYWHTPSGEQPVSLLGV